MKLSHWSGLAIFLMTSCAHSPRSAYRGPASGNEKPEPEFEQSDDLPRPDCGDLDKRAKDYLSSLEKLKLAQQKKGPPASALEFKSLQIPVDSQYNLVKESVAMCVVRAEMIAKDLWSDPKLADAIDEGCEDGLVVLRHERNLKKSENVKNPEVHTVNGTAADCENRVHSTGLASPADEY